MNTLQQRYQSEIDSPVSTYGRSVYVQPDIKYTLYTGIAFTSFLHKNNVDPFEVRSFLKSNRVGNPFTGLIVGQLVKIESQNKFAQNPDFG